jgi:uncharacterized membrane protein
MKEYQYHLINAAIAGALVMLGSLSSILLGNPTWEKLIIGFFTGLVAGAIIFLNKFNDWFSLQDKCKKKKRSYLFDFL